MATSQFPTGRFKKGNGVEFLMHQEIQAQKKNVREMKPVITDINNHFYFKMKDDLSKQQKKLKSLREKEVQAENEKMYSKIVSILSRETRSLSKTRSPGPISLNIGFRRRQINSINMGNEKLSKKLDEAQSNIPSKGELKKFNLNQERFKRCISTRRPTGEQVMDPLIKKRKNFVIATSEMNSFIEQATTMSRTLAGFNQTQDTSFLPKGAGTNPRESLEASIMSMTNSQGFPVPPITSRRVESAKKSLPFNTLNMKKHSLRQKLIEIENQETDYYNMDRRPLNFTMSSGLRAQKTSSTNMTNGQMEKTPKKKEKSPPVSPLRKTIDKIIQSSNTQLTQPARKHFINLNTISGGGVTEPDSIIKGKIDLESKEGSTAKKPPKKPSVFTKKRRTEQSTDLTPSLNLVSKLDFNNMKFDFSQMIFDDNERADAQEKLRAKKKLALLDPFSKQLLKKKTKLETKGSGSVSPWSIGRKQSTSTNKNLDGLMSIKNDSTMFNPRRGSQNNYELFPKNEPISQSNKSIHGDYQIGLGAGFLNQDSKRSLTKSKKMLSGYKRSINKSPLDVHDYTNLTRPDENPNFSKFMNQNSSEQLDFNLDPQGDNETQNDGEMIEEAANEEKSFDADPRRSTLPQAMNQSPPLNLDTSENIGSNALQSSKELAKSSVKVSTVKTSQREINQVIELSSQAIDLPATTERPTFEKEPASGLIERPTFEKSPVSGLDGNRTTETRKAAMDIWKTLPTDIVRNEQVKEMKEEKKKNMANLNKKAKSRSRKSHVIRAPPPLMAEDDE